MRSRPTVVMNLHCDMTPKAARAVSSPSRFLHGFGSHSEKPLAQARAAGAGAAFTKVSAPSNALDRRPRSHRRPSSRRSVRGAMSSSTAARRAHRAASRSSMLLGSFVAAVDERQFRCPVVPNRSLRSGQRPHVGTDSSATSRPRCSTSPPHDLEGISCGGHYRTTGPVEAIHLIRAFGNIAFVEKIGRVE